MNSLVVFASGIVVAVVSAFVTVELTLRRFYRERWWDQKLTMYTRIIDALFQLKLYADEQVYAYDAQREISDEREDELRQHWRSGQHEIKRAAATGAFVISDEASASLSRLIEDLRSSYEEEHWYVRIRSYQAATDQCLAELRELAKVDLQVSRAPQRRAARFSKTSLHD